ncbi:hypothetical protein O6H91_Y448300 [Diphasiastrum complanatum]|nr:hypothetical protein O6H91_Y448300 [Diphasiastrum complanatum]
MGRCPNHKKPSKNRYSHKSARRSKFLVKGDDLIHQDIQKQRSTEVSQPLDEDLPGLGQFYCLHCDRYFGSETAQNDHFKTKRHKKR